MHKKRKTQFIKYKKEKLSKKETTVHSVVSNPMAETPNWDINVAKKYKKKETSVMLSIPAAGRARAPEIHPLVAFPELAFP